MRILFFLFLLTISCSSTDEAITGDSNATTTVLEEANESNDTDPAENEETMPYFPPLDSAEWETVSIAALGWNTNAIDDLEMYLADTETAAFIILKNGRIALEYYYGNHDINTNFRWNSAAKTLTATTVGIAQSEGYLNIDDPTSDYLGLGWTAMDETQENAISIRNQLTMTTGGDFNVPNLNCTDPDCLDYLNNAGDAWYYHNAFYILLQDVVASATATDFDAYFNTTIQTKIGMQGFWFPLGYTRLYLSPARSMARFGLLSIHNGNWNGDQVLQADFYQEMTASSQNLNKAYGYLWWLNGQETFMLPGTTVTFSGKLIPTAPNDLFAGLGKDDQKLYVVPSEDLVVVRLGGASGEEVLGPSGYDTALWEKIMEVVD